MDHLSHYNNTDLFFHSCHNNTRQTIKNGSPNKSATPHEQPLGYIILYEAWTHISSIHCLLIFNTFDSNNTINKECTGIIIMDSIVTLKCRILPN